MLHWRGDGGDGLWRRRGDPTLPGRPLRTGLRNGTRLWSTRPLLGCSRRPLRWNGLRPRGRRLLRRGRLDRPLGKRRHWGKRRHGAERGGESKRYNEAHVTLH